MESFSRLSVVRVIVLIAIMSGMVKHAGCQLTRTGNPLPVDYPGLSKLMVYSVAVSEQEKAGMFLPEMSLLKPARSGILVPVDYSINNAGQWDTLKDGTRVWRAAFHVPGVRLLSLILSPFHVTRGVRIFLYDRTQQNILGAFSDLNNRGNGLLATGEVPGDLLTIEVQVPAYVSDPGIITVNGIGCDFSTKAALKQTSDEWFGASGSCNTDIACASQPAYKIVKNAVVRIVYLGNERCTGTLINNALTDGRNYVLTAGHCIQSELVANTAVFYFDYESPFCSGPDGPSSMSVSGATLRSVGRDLDFALLELIESPPFTYHPYYSGWNRSVVPPSSAYTIHHPLGDVKKISFDDQSLTISTFPGLYNPQTHWKVSQWATGTTEAGSSGAGLFDPDNRLRGSLTGGEASCGNSVNDYFQMFSHSWSDNADASHQLAFWLDPKLSGENLLEGYDPYKAFWDTGDTLSNLIQGESVGTVSSGLTWGSWSGHNSSSFTLFAEHFSVNGRKKVLGLLLDVAHNYVASAASHLVVRIWEDKGMPGNTLFEKQVPLADLASGRKMFLAFDSAISVADSFYAGYELFYGSPQDTFAVSMASGRVPPQTGTAWVYDGSWSTLAGASNGQVISSFAVMPVVYDSVPPVTPPVAFPEPVRIYPNPARDGCWIEFSELKPATVELSVFDATGKLIEKTSYGSYQRSIHLGTSGYKPGVYVVSVKQGAELHRIKLVVIR